MGKGDRKTERGRNLRLGAGRQAGSKQQQRSTQDGLTGRPVPRRRQQVCVGRAVTHTCQRAFLFVCVS